MIERRVQARGGRAACEHVRLELDEEELLDISVVVERARGAALALARILADKVAVASGSVVVGCESSMYSCVACYV